MTRKEEYKCAMLALYRSGRDFITLDDFKELSTYADKLTRYLRECLE